MENASEVFQVFGLIAILFAITFFFVRVIRFIIGERKNHLRFGVELIIFFAIVFFFAKPALNYVGIAAWGQHVANAAAFLWWVSLAFLINVALKRFVWSGVLADHGSSRVPRLFRDGLAILVYAAAIMIVMHFVYEEPIGAVLATSGAMALILGLSAQSTIKEVFSGVALNTTKALRLGDFVEIDGVYGQVYDINWRSIALKNPHTDSLYIFPNSAVAERTILNFNEPTDRFKYYVKFVSELSAPPELVIRAIANELENSRYVIRDPKPDFNILGFTDRGIEIRIRYYFDGDDPWWDAQNEVCMAIWSAMRKHGLKIAIDRHELLTGDEWDTVAELAKAQVAESRVSDVLRSNPLFENIAEGELTQLAASATASDLNPPGCFYRVGDEARHVFLLMAGQVSLFDLDPKRGETKVETCSAGELFGFESLLKGLPHCHMAQSEQYSTVAELDAKIFGGILERNRQLKADLQAHLDEREKLREKEIERERVAWTHAQHLHTRKHLTDQIRRSVEGVLEKPIFHHVFDHILSNTSHEEFLTAMMAGSALVCTARGEVDEDELKYLRETLDETDLVRHVDIEHGIELFSGFTSQIADNPDAGRTEALKRISKCKQEAGKAQLVIAFCHGLSRVHGEPTPDEMAALSLIAKCLGVTDDVSNTVSALSGHTLAARGSQTEQNGRSIGKSCGQL